MQGCYGPNQAKTLAVMGGSRRVPIVNAVNQLRVLDVDADW